MLERLLLLVLMSLLVSVPCGAADADPRDPEIEIQQRGVRMTLVAEHPDVVTPTGIDVDDKGTVWVVASHTHFRPDDYEGPEHDEILVFNPDGQRKVFLCETDATMDLELGPDGWVYLAERDRILRVKDTDGDGVGDLQEDIATLETEGDYPHNGLSGLAWHPNGDLIFSLGENFWKPWTLSGKDDTSITGTGEGGVFRCRPDGSSLRRVAHGFWNPFGICVRDDGLIFAAENDPGARPPCRLLHVVEGGDYGYQRHYGNSPFHPFVCWNGELRGTLPMLHALAEAPCGIAPLYNGLVVPSWTDHRIDFYPLTASGASFSSERISLVLGGHDFRPTGICQASPTVFYLADWVVGSYPIHKRGRIWKLEIDPAEADWLGGKTLPPPNKEARLATQLRQDGSQFSNQELFRLARSEDPFLSLAAVDALARRTRQFDEHQASQLSIDDQLSLLLAIRKASPQDEKWVRHFLGSSNADIRFETLRWIADSNLKPFLADVETILADAKIDFPVFEACLATWNTLSGTPESGIADAKMLFARVNDPQATPRTRAFALRLLDPTQKMFSKTLWTKLLKTENPLLVTELTRALVATGTDPAREFLTAIAEDESIDTATRGDAIAGLGQADGGLLEKLVAFAGSSDRTLREEALRSLRFTKMSPAQVKQLQEIASRHSESADLVKAAIAPESVKIGRPEPGETETWRQRLANIKQPIDLAAGRRLFHHASVGTCVKCHRHSGRGSAVGPDLSAVSNLGDPVRILRALLEPSRDVDPQYFPRMLVTEDGQVFTGIMLRDGGGGKEFYRDSAGREKMFLTEEIVQRKELATSMMPDGLIDLMTDREIRDLIAFMDLGAQLGNAQAQPQ